MQIRLLLVTRRLSFFEYGMEHMGRTMAATSVEAVKAALRRRYKTPIATAAWKGYANPWLDMTKYVGTGGSRNQQGLG
jgi:hypothetical protein